MSYTIPCPKRACELSDLLPKTAPIRLSAIAPEGKERELVFIATPEHSFESGANRDRTLAKFWETVSPHLKHSSTCILRQHGRQTVLQINI